MAIRALAAPPESPDPVRPSSADDARALSTCLFQRLRTLEPGTAEHAYVRGTLVELNLTLVRYAASRFRHRSEPLEDIIQVGTIGLIKAIDRFDVDREVAFSSFALPTIVGEIKRFFRDASWTVRVPRRLQELRIDTARAYDTLEQRLERPPTTAELAAHLGISEEAVAEGQQAANGYVVRSLDAPDGSEDSCPGSLERRLGEEDHAFDVIECLESLRPLVAGLAPRDRAILSMRFGEELTQSEIGARLGLSQMHVSRLLARTLSTLRAGLLEDGPSQPPCPEGAASPNGGHSDAAADGQTGREARAAG
ncbi:SigB/SigF/SigG family RNA polymerase sigma factor [Streptomyces sp. MUM 178J]|uniref:SigB/SigF/SigG family RNA polymerase sigma factor n=1 Tax=Streptomyces sp. MUM 178J TaxID=2791991 RepID=UPI001F047008|nr:SigB/SigF/SigG family RNA polymerase sigma factor [Streptomyces sp. MUM 178J]WRQ78295.1 SigB/SigF/SigG family RNA polymerase sigma factor [Streptomyces sp. MUM 178J]